jgi:DNA-binding response OmpR family regulator
MCLTGKRALVLEDTPSIALLLAASLKRQGCAVDVKTKVSEALELCIGAAKCGIGVDIILADVMLDGKPGTQLPCALLASGLDIPIIMMSADGSEVTKAQCLAAGARFFFEKPFDISVVLKQMKSTFYQRPSMAMDDIKEIDAARNKLRKSYYKQLEELKTQISVSIGPEKMRSILHQTKGSASLYGLTALSKKAHVLSEKLHQGGLNELAVVRQDFYAALSAELTVVPSK